MAKRDTSARSNKGQEQMHEIVDETGARRSVSQSEWQARDKNLGWVRVDENEAAQLPDDEAATAPDADADTNPA